MSKLGSVAALEEAGGLFSHLSKAFCKFKAFRINEPVRLPPAPGSSDTLGPRWPLPAEGSIGRLTFMNDTSSITSHSTVERRQLFNPFLQSGLTWVDEMGPAPELTASAGTS